MKTFRHSGKIGDVVYSLPAVRALGGGILYLKPEPAFRFTPEAAQALIPLLGAQSYIEEAKLWQGEPFDTDLDGFRQLNPSRVTIAEIQLGLHRLPREKEDEPWLTAPKAEGVPPILFARSLSYRGEPGFWEEAYARFGPSAYFIGLPEEHEIFEMKFGHIPFKPTGDLLELAGFLSGARLFVGNQSGPLAIAEGLKMPVIQEVSRQAPNCIYERADALHVRDALDVRSMARFARVFGLPAELSADEKALLELVPEAVSELHIVCPSNAAVDLDALQELVALERPEVIVRVFDPDYLPASRPMSSGDLAAASQGPSSNGRRAPTASEPLLSQASVPVASVSPGRETLERSALSMSALRSKLHGSLYRMLDHRTVNAANIGRLAHFELSDRIAPIGSPSAGLLGPATKEGVSVVVVTYNSATTIRECLDSVLLTLDGDDELILVDNHSSDDTLSYLGELAKRRAEAAALESGVPVPPVRRGPRPAQRFPALNNRPSLTILRCRENLGYSLAANAGMLESQGRTIALLNPDAIVPRDWLKGLPARLAMPGVGLVGPVCDNVAGRQFVSFHLKPEDRALLPWQINERVKELHHGESEETKLLMGFCLLARREVLDRVGLLDVQLFLGSDDLDLCLRVRSHGFKLLIARDVFVEHRMGTSFKSLSAPEVQRLLGESTMALRRKIRAIFAPGPEPSSEDLWGIPILPQDAPVEEVRNDFNRT